MILLNNESAGYNISHAIPLTRKRSSISLKGGGAPGGAFQKDFNITYREYREYLQVQLRECTQAAALFRQ